MNNANTIIGNYRIISTIGYGSSSCVYLACHHVHTKQMVALKVMHAIPPSLTQERNRFLQEAHILKLLEHPHILSILDVGIDDGTPYIASEYASGASLRKRLLDRGPQLLPIEEVRGILFQVGQALQYTHDLQIIHRDIKPENILFDAEGNALLADFGLAMALSTISVNLINVGTPRYMAPEQFQDRVSGKSDQYALGCIAYELFTGHPPFEDSNLLALMYKHVHEIPVPLSQYNPLIPKYIEQAVLKALMKRPDERHSEMRDFVCALQGPVTGQLVTPYATQPALTFEQTGSVANDVENDTLPMSPYDTEPAIPRLHHRS